MTDRELIKNSLEEFASVQEYIGLITNIETECQLYEKLKMRYQILKAFLTNSGLNMTDIDKLNL